MLKKHVIASILAIITTFYSGGLNLAFATTQTTHTNTTPSAKAAICSGPLLTPLCGKILNTCDLSKSISYSLSNRAVSMPQKMTNEIFATPERGDENTDNKPLFAYSYSVAQASPTPNTSITIVPKPTVAVQAATAYNVEAPTQPTSGGLNADVIFSLVNQVRAQHGLPAFERDDRVCTIANERAPELHNEIYVNGNMHAGLARRQPEIPYRVTENMISQQTEQQAVTWWMNSSIHRSAILGSSTHSCVSCQGNSCAMLFTSFVAK